MRLGIVSNCTQEFFFLVPFYGMLVLMGRRKVCTKNTRKKNNLLKLHHSYTEIVFQRDDKRTFIASVLPFEFKTLNMVCRRNCMTNDLPMLKVPLNYFFFLFVDTIFLLFNFFILVPALVCRSSFHGSQPLHFDLFALHMTTQM